MLRAAQEAAHAQGLRPWLWRIAVSLGNLYRASRRQEEAGQAFANARIIIEELAANVADENLRAKFLSSALPLLPRPHPLTPRRATRLAYGGLTEREREVAILLAEGKSNREIAERLVVGIRTVEVHVSSILARLDFTSRAQIAVWAHEKGLAE
jgi:DNA-binding NarL/FixJ family response regulator